MKKITDFFNNLVQKYMPDPFVLCIFLLVLVFAAGVIWTPSSPLDMLNYFGQGVWGILGFAMQLSFVIVAASAVANTPPIKRFVKKIAKLPKNPGQAVFYVSLVTSMVGLINWGVALVVGVIYAKEVAKQVKGSHFPLLIAASYAGFTIWSAGISSSIPLSLNTAGHALENDIGIIPLTDTVFSLYNIIIAAAMMLSFAFTSKLMTPAADKAVSLETSIFEDEDDEHNSYDSGNVSVMKEATVASKLENNRIISSVAGLFCIIYFLYSVGKGGLNALNLNSVNLITLGIGLMMYKGVVPYIKAVSASAASVIPIMMLYPFYSAISTMITNSGLGALITDWFASVATQTTLPVITFLTAGFINTVVPADGGHLLLQGPIFLPLAKDFGLSTGLITMAMAIGANWSNMLQPFWALPALALAKLGIRDIMGYCIVNLIVSGIVASILFTVLPLII